MLRLTLISSAGGKVIHKNFTQSQVNKMITLYSACFNESTLLDDSHYIICIVEPEPDELLGRLGATVIEIESWKHNRGNAS